MLCDDACAIEEVLSAYDIILVPNYRLPDFPENSIDLVVNTIGFSEMNYSTVVEYFKQIDRICSGYFYHENGVDFIDSYKSYSTKTFPKLNTFKEIFTAQSRWLFFNEKNYVALECLYEKCG